MRSEPLHADPANAATPDRCLARFEGVRLAGIAAAVPAHRIPLAAFAEAFGEEFLRKFSQMTGVREIRRAHPAQTASDLAFLAAENLLAGSGVRRDRIGLLLFVTQKPDYRVPATAYFLQQRLGLADHCLCLDINLACSGYLYALHAALALMRTTSREGAGPAALVLTGDTSMRTLSPLDRSVYPLFGDGGSATLLVSDEAAPPVSSALWTDGTRFQALITPAGAYRNPLGELERRERSDGIARSDYDTQMKGAEVFEFSITDVADFLAAFFRAMDRTPEDFDAIALHQANRFILRQLARKIGIPAGRLPISIDRFGNTSSNSVPLTLCDCYGGKEGQSLRVLACGFGGGLSIAGAAFEVMSDAIFPLIESDECLIPAP